MWEPVSLRPFVGKTRPKKLTWIIHLYSRIWRVSSYLKKEIPKSRSIFSSIFQLITRSLKLKLDILNAQPLTCNIQHSNILHWALWHSQKLPTCWTCCSSDGWWQRGLKYWHLTEKIVVYSRCVIIIINWRSKHFYPINITSKPKYK